MPMQLLFKSLLINLFLLLTSYLLPFAFPLHFPFSSSCFCLLLLAFFFTYFVVAHLTPIARMSPRAESANCDQD
ncbi:hypothetical protein T492DRAFT_415636 [Pavlovales sp. CCMP2436]|nr:hypothetical protein T492DRAFT_415636 [Pavlovales sp. CCMP2436]